MSVRILIVDDHPLWADWVHACLQREPRCEVVGQASDGADALTAAARVHPDLILLDIALPRINGIEVARRILTTTPATRILFLSQERSSDVAEEALRIGARGFLLKSDAGRELMPAVHAIADGKTYVSRTFVEALAATTNAQAPLKCLRHHDALCSADETAIVNAYAQFTYDGLSSGASAIVVAPRPRLGAVRERLRTYPIDLDEVAAEGRYRPLDVAELFDECIRDGCPDEARFETISSTLMSEANAAARGPRARVVACGEASAVLWQQGHHVGSVRFEQLWDRLATTMRLDILCGYALTPAAADQEDELRRAIDGTHSRVLQA